MFIKPEIIKNFEIRPGMVVADFGSGSGHYVLAVAQKMNNTGVVYAIDIQKNLLEAIKSEAAKQHLSNVDIIWADIESKRDETGQRNAGLAIASNILFQIGDKSLGERDFQNAKNGGRTAVIDWSASFGGAGPALKAVVPQKERKEFSSKKDFWKKENFRRETIIMG